MPTFVSRVFSVIVLLAIVCYLIPDLEEHQQKVEQPTRRVSSIYQSNIASLPRDLKIIDDLPYQQGTKSRWRMNLVLPLQASLQPRPALIFVHAGGWSGGSSASYSQAGPLYYARKGYVCVSLHHRLADDTLFEDCLEDLKCVIRWMRAHADKYQIDPQRIGAFGNANGGSMICLVGLMGKDRQVEAGRPWQDHSSELNAICISAAPTDYQCWPDGIEHLPRLIRLAWNDKTELKKQAAKASPITYVHADAPPILVMHGVLDRTVDVSQTDHFVDALKAAGAKDVTYFRSEKSGHAVFLRNRTRTFPMMEEFFARTLGYPQGIKVAQK